MGLISLFTTILAAADGAMLPSLVRSALRSAQA